MAMQRYRVTLANRDTGAERRRTLDAQDETEARSVAQELAGQPWISGRVEMLGKASGAGSRVLWMLLPILAATVFATLRWLSRQ